MSGLRIAIADDHAVVRMGYRRLLDSEPGLCIVAEYASVDEAERALLAQPAPEVDLLLLDLSMPGRGGLALLRLLNLKRPDLPVIVVSMHDTANLVAQCLHAGALAFVAKSGDPMDLVRAVQRVQARGPGGRTEAERAHPSAQALAPHELLTVREAEALQWLLGGAGLDEVATRMGLSEKTVSNYQTAIRQKLGVGNAIELLQYAHSHGLMP